MTHTIELHHAKYHNYKVGNYNSVTLFNTDLDLQKGDWLAISFPKPDGSTYIIRAEITAVDVAALPNIIITTAHLAAALLDGERKSDHILAPASEQPTPITPVPVKGVENG